MTQIKMGNLNVFLSVRVFEFYFIVVENSSQNIALETRLRAKDV